MTAAIRSAGLAVLLAALTGCGYSLQGALPDHVKTIAVPIFHNRTTQPGVEVIVTRAVVEAFSTSGRLRVASTDDADALLEGELINYQIHSIAFDPQARVRLMRVIVTLNLRVRDLRQNQLLLEQKGFSERAEIRVSDLVAETIAREDAALRVAARDIARSIVAFTIDRF
jgi:outer membrane lipopolysaccharide assembly protein LptE/RlpB